MKKLAIALLSATLLSTSACADNSASNNVVATYSEGKVTDKQIMDYFHSTLENQEVTKGKSFSELDSKMQEALLKQYIMTHILEKEADKLGITKSVEFKDSMKNAKNYIIQNEIAKIKTKGALSKEAIDQEYKKIVNVLKGQKEVKVSHIVVEDENTAKDIKNQIINGSSFEVLAKKYSKDESSKVQGGDLGYIHKGTVVPEFEEKVFAMKKNEVSNPVKTSFGWHIIKVHNIRNIKVPKQSEIENEIKAQIANRVFSEYVQQLEKTAKIEITK